VDSPFKNNINDLPYIKKVMKPDEIKQKRQKMKQGKDDWIDNLIRKEKLNNLNNILNNDKNDDLNNIININNEEDKSAFLTNIGNMVESNLNFT